MDEMFVKSKRVIEGIRLPALSYEETTCASTGACQADACFKGRFGNRRWRCWTGSLLGQTGLAIQG